MMKKQKSKILKVLIFVVTMSFSVVLSNMFFAPQKNVDASAQTVATQEKDWGEDKKYADDVLYEEWRLDYLSDDLTKDTTKVEDGRFAGNNRLTTLTVSSDDGSEFDAHSSYGGAKIWVNINPDGEADNKVENNVTKTMTVHIVRYSDPKDPETKINQYDLTYNVNDGYELVGFRFYDIITTQSLSDLLVTGGNGETTYEYNYGVQLGIGDPKNIDENTGNYDFKGLNDDPKVAINKDGDLIDENGNAYTVADYYRNAEGWFCDNDNNKINPGYVLKDIDTVSKDGSLTISYDASSEFYKTDNGRTYNPKGSNSLFRYDLNGDPKFSLYPIEYNLGTLIDRFDDNGGVKTACEAVRVSEKFYMQTADDSLIYIVPVCRLLNYDLQMNYDEYNQDGRQWNAKVENFNVRTPLTLVHSDDFSIENQSLNSWVFKFDKTKWLEDSESGDYIWEYCSGESVRLSIDGDNITIKSESSVYYGKFELRLTWLDCLASRVDENLIFYKIGNIAGFWNENTSDKAFVLNFDYDKKYYNGSESEKGKVSDPLIRATWDYKFKTLIDNTVSDYFSNKVLLPEDEENKKELDYAGVVVGGGSAGQSGEMRISSDDDGNYPLLADQSKAFYKKNELEISNEKNDKKYSLYNYGYEVSGWKLYFDPDGDGTSSYFEISTDGKKNSVNVVEGATVNEIDDSFPTEFITSDISNVLYDYYIDGYDTSKLAVTMEPQWKAAEIDLIDGSGRSVAEGVAFNSKTKYNTRLFETNNGKNGQTLFAYETVKDTSDRCLVAKGDGKNVWNYVNLSYNQFEEYDSTNNLYQLKVNPVYKNNVYAVRLNGLFGDLISEDTDYTNKTNFSKYTLQNIGFTIHDLAYNLVNDFEISDCFDYIDCGFAEYSSAVDYVDLLVKIEEWYDEKVEVNCPSQDSNSLDIFKNIYSSFGSYYIMLVNEKNPGRLPVFELDSYSSIIYWGSKNLDYYDKFSMDAYVTKQFDWEENKQDIKSFANFSGKTYADDVKTDTIIEDQVFLYSHMETGDQTLYMGLFRKYFWINLNTIRETEAPGRYGYIFVEVKDNVYDEEDENNKSTSFIAVYKDGYIKLYQDMSELSDLDGKESLAYECDFAEDLFNNKDASGNSLFRLYAGCGLTLRMSCVDYLPDSGQFDNMIGFRFVCASALLKDKYGDGVEGKTDLENDGNVGWANFANATDYTISNETIQDANISTASVFTINAIFTPIEYDLSAKIDDSYAGLIQIDRGLSTNQGGNIIKVVNSGTDSLTIDAGEKRVEYLANAGFTLQSTAFTFNGTELLEYTDGGAQYYQFVFDGKWLREYFYNAIYAENKYKHVYENVEKADLNNIEVFTTTYNFNVKLQVVHNGTVLTVVNVGNDSFIMSGDKNSEKSGVFTYLGTTYNGLSSTLLLALKDNGSYVLNKLNGALYVYNHTNNVKYVPTSLHLSGVASSDYRLNLPFYFEEDSSSLAKNVGVEYLNKNYNKTSVLLGEDRTLKINLNVAELITVNIYEENLDGFVNPNGYRTVSFSSNYVNTSYVNNITSEDLSKTVVNPNTSILTVYTIDTIQNYLSAHYDSARYKGVEASWKDSGTAVEINNPFILNASKTDLDIVIKFVPKEIVKLNIKYYRDGKQMSGESTIKKYITTTLSETKSDKSLNPVFEYVNSGARVTGLQMYHEDWVKLCFEIVDTKYYCEITVNGVKCDDIESVVCIVDDASLLNAYENGGFDVVVNLIEVPSQAILIKYSVLGLSLTSDELGDFEIYINGSLESPIGKTSDYYRYSITENSKVVVKLTRIANGFKFGSLKHLSTIVEQAISASGEVILANSYNFGSHSGFYTIDLEKEDIAAELVVSGSMTKYMNQYQMSASDGQNPAIKTDFDERITSLTVQIGKSLVFTNVDNNDERLAYYYYENSSNEEVKITPAANGSLKLLLTSDVLDNLTRTAEGGWKIVFQIKVDKKYSMKYYVLGQQYADNVSVSYTDKDTAVKSDYISEQRLINGRIYLNIEPGSDGTAEKKYNVELVGVAAVAGLYTGDVVEKEFNLTSDCELIIKIVPKLFSGSYEESIYTSIEQLDGEESPTLVTDPLMQIGGLSQNSGQYNYMITLSVALSDSAKTRGQLYTLELTGNDIGADYKIVITLDEDLKKYSIKKCKDGESGGESVNDYIVSINRTTQKLEFTFKVKNNFKISTTYKKYVSIMPSGS